jgi:carbamoyltransferase
LEIAVESAARHGEGALAVRMNILGISAFGDGSGAALLVDGKLAAAAEEERFSRRRRDASLPKRSVRFCLEQGGIQIGDVDFVVFYEKPLKRFERVLSTQLRSFPRSVRTFPKTLFHWLGDRLWLKNELAAELGVDPARIVFSEHAASHASGAFFCSPFEDAAILVADDAGEWATTALAKGSGSELEIVEEIHFPNSLGLLASSITQFLGFEPGADEEKVAALAAHGKPRFESEISRLVDVAGDGSFAVDTKLFRFAFDEENLLTPALARLFGEPRLPSQPVRYAVGAGGADDNRRDADLAASLQCVLERCLLGLAAELARRVPSKNLCLSGQLAWNVAANARLVADGPFERLFVQPAAGDAGGALGAALYFHHVGLGAARHPAMEHPFVGESVLADPGDTFAMLADEDRLIDEVTARLLRGELVGWIRGRFEWGPRSLGHRSVLADPRARDIRARVSRRVKRREDFLPFSPAVAAERANELFETPTGAALPARFMQICLSAKDRARAFAPDLVHADGCARPQIVSEDGDPLFHRLLTRFGEAAGEPSLLQTSLNLRGDPLVRGEADGRSLFDRSSLDALVVEDRLYARDPARAS